MFILLNAHVFCRIYIVLVAAPDYREAKHDKDFPLKTFKEIFTYRNKESY